MSRSNLETAAKRLAGVLRDVANYPVPDNATLNRVHFIVGALGDREGRSVEAVYINDAVDRLVGHWKNLLEAQQSPHPLGRESYPVLEAQIQRVLRFRELYFEERDQLEKSEQLVVR